MHLLAAQPGAISDGSEPVDLGQTPADVVFISAADTELAALSEARAALGRRTAATIRADARAISRIRCRWTCIWTPARQNRGW